MFNFVAQETNTDIATKLNDELFNLTFIEGENLSGIDRNLEIIKKYGLNVDKGKKYMESF